MRGGGEEQPSSNIKEPRGFPYFLQKLANLASSGGRLYVKRGNGGTSFITRRDRQQPSATGAYLIKKFSRILSLSLSPLSFLSSLFHNTHVRSHVCRDKEIMGGPRVPAEARENCFCFCRYSAPIFHGNVPL